MFNKLPVFHERLNLSKNKNLRYIFGEYMAVYFLKID